MKVLMCPVCCLFTMTLKMMLLLLLIPQ